MRHGVERGRRDGRTNDHIRTPFIQHDEPTQEELRQGTQQLLNNAVSRKLMFGDGENMDTLSFNKRYKGQQVPISEMSEHNEEDQSSD